MDDNYPCLKPIWILFFAILVISILLILHRSNFVQTWSTTRLAPLNHSKESPDESNDNNIVTDDVPKSNPISLKHITIPSVKHSKDQEHHHKHRYNNSKDQKHHTNHDKDKCHPPKYQYYSDDCQHEYIDSENSFTISAPQLGSGFINIDSCNSDRGTITWGLLSAFSWKIKWENRAKRFVRIYQTQCDLHQVHQVQNVQNVQNIRGQGVGTNNNKNPCDSSSSNLLPTNNSIDLSQTYGWMHGIDFKENLPRLWVGVSLLNYWTFNENYNNVDNNHNQIVNNKNNNVSQNINNNTTLPINQGFNFDKVSAAATRLDSYYGPATFRLIDAKSVQRWSLYQGCKKFILDTYKPNQFIIQNVQSGYYLYLDNQIPESSNPNAYIQSIAVNNSSNIVNLKQSTLRLRMVSFLDLYNLDNFVFTFDKVV